MSHYLGLVHLSLPESFTAEQVHKAVRARLDWEIEALEKANRPGPDYCTFAGLVGLERVAEVYAAYAYNPTSADDFDSFDAFACWLSLENPTIARGQRRSIKAEPFSAAVIDALMPRPPDGHDSENVDALIDSFGVSEWRAERLCRYVMNAVSARVLALEDYPTQTERLIRCETWRPSAAPDLGHPFIYAADGAAVISGAEGLTPAARGAHFKLKRRSILPAPMGRHWLAFVDFHI